MKPKISIIVPVYNVERYISECIDSIISQSFQDFELILINDGTRDNSFEICKKYAVKDSRIILVEQENGGVSTARNKGVKYAQGIYLVFVDSDDILVENTLYELYNIAINNDVDIVISKIFRFTDRNLRNTYANFQDKYIDFNGVRELSLDRIAIIDSSKKIDDVYWFGFSSCLYKMDILVDNNITFPLFRVGEDSLFLTEYLINSASAYIIGKDLYGYRQNQNSVTNQFVPNYLEDVKLRANYVDNLLSKYSSKFDVEYIERFNISHSSRLYQTIMMFLKNPSIKQGKIKFKECKDDMQKHYDEIKPYSDYLTSKQKSKIRLIKLITSSLLLFTIYKQYYKK